jgi:hypothetical protein
MRLNLATRLLTLDSKGTGIKGSMIAILKPIFANPRAMAEPTIPPPTTQKSNTLFFLFQYLITLTKKPNIFAKTYNSNLRR